MGVLSTDVLRGDAIAGCATRMAGTSKTLGSCTDRELMAIAAKGDERALGELYDRFAPAAYGLALHVLRDRQLAEDAVQEAFLSVWRTAIRFDSRRGSARSWILMLVHRRAVDLVARNQRQLIHDYRAPSEPLAPSAAEANALDTKRRTVQAALASLPARQQTVLRFAFYGGYTQREIATGLELPIGTVKSQTFEGLRRLRCLLTPAGRRSI